MSTHNICFRGEIRKNIMWIPLLSVAIFSVTIPHLILLMKHRHFFNVNNGKCF